MIAVRQFLLTTLILSIVSIASVRADERESLKIEALEALMSAPPERALPILTKVLRGKGSDELKEHALFVLGQIDLPEARALLLESARSGSAQLRAEAIRAIGIGGDPAALADLASVYAGGDESTRDAVLEAYLIADYRKGVYDIAVKAQDPQEFENAVETLGSMGATQELRSLRDRPGSGEALIQAYIVANDVESLGALARDGSDPQRQAEALQALGATGGEESRAVLLDVYRSTDSPAIREAAREGLMISGDDEAMLELYHSSTDPAEKRELLRMLVNMDSDALWSIIDQTLEEDGQ